MPWIKVISAHATITLHVLGCIISRFKKVCAKRKTAQFCIFILRSRIYQLNQDVYFVNAIQVTNKWSI